MCDQLSAIADQPWNAIPLQKTRLQSFVSFVCCRSATSQRPLDQATMANAALPPLFKKKLLRSFSRGNCGVRVRPSVHLFGRHFDGVEVEGD